MPPGGQPRMIMDMLVEAVDYLRDEGSDHRAGRSRAESLHMSMMTPEAQLRRIRSSSAASQIIVSYPTDTMEYDARLQSMRGNNIPASRTRRRFTR